MSTNSHSWFGSDNAIPGGVDLRALDPFGPGEGVTLGRGLVNQLLAPLVLMKSRAPFSLPRLDLRNTPEGDFALLPQSSLYATPTLRRGIRPLPIEDRIQIIRNNCQIHRYR